LIHGWVIGTNAIGGPPSRLPTKADPHTTGANPPTSAPGTFPTHPNGSPPVVRRRRGVGPAAYKADREAKQEAARREEEEEARREAAEEEEVRREVAGREAQGST